MIHSRVYKGYIYVSEDVVRTRDELNYWIGLAIDCNPREKSINDPTRQE